jgi:hypothetical protein
MAREADGSMARKRIQAWVWVIGAGLCTCLFSACNLVRTSHLVGDSNAKLVQVPGPPRALAEGNDPGLARRDDPASPYHIVSPPLLIPDRPDVQIRQAIYPPATDLGFPDWGSPPRPSLVMPPPETGGGPKPSEKPAPDIPLVAALRCFMEKRPAEAIALLKTYDKSNQEVLLSILPLIARLAGESLERAQPSEYTTFLEQLQNAQVALRERAELLIDKMVLCESISNFGLYKSLEKGHRFQAATPGHPAELVQVYVELRNPSTQYRDGMFETCLSSRVQIRKTPGKPPVWQHDFQDRDKPILSWSLPTDFFKYYSFYVPDLPPGEYTLTIEIVDVLTSRTAQKSLGFRVTKLPGVYE